ncbi:ABC transporter ATP-binding protein [Butyrivibrio sp. MC2013]|uniref:ABC transporter ATP-binding protein n=1 Tax=Butyrivibrio sp. MC2013 TaxID=1280686 RepID=UPI000419D3E6|nr:ABC transporter ATP-binding protein [Butyrivibrio sp. MC2013]
MKEDVICLSRITKTYDGKNVLNDISLKIKKNEIFGLLGPSGAGKTTIVRLLTGQINADSGSAEVFEENTSGLTSSDKRKIGIVMDNYGVYERLSCKDNLELFARIYNIDPQRIDFVLKKVGLAGESKKAAGKLSKGMRQRLILGRAILHEPELLFLDEPTSGLDPVTSSHIHDLLFELRENGTTIFLTTHNMNEATKMCDNIALLNCGKIIEYGNPKEICSRYNTDFSVTVKTIDGKVLCLKKDSENWKKLVEVIVNKDILSIHSNEPNLEDVFLQVTGRGLE